MIPRLLDSNFDAIIPLELFDSFLWVDRYNTFGDFEFVSVPFINYLQALSTAKYLSLDESEHTMFLEYINIKTDPVNGNKLILKGKSLESMLDRRIIWNPTSCVGNMQEEFFLKILNENIINSDPTERRINGFLMEMSEDDYITSLEINDQFFGKYIYDAVSNTCKINDIGFKIIFHRNYWFIFELYNGKDRSSLQSENPQVVFSSKFQNLITADYIRTDQLLKTVAKVVGEEGIGNIQLTATAYAKSGGGSDLNRRELFLEATDVRKETDEGTLSDEEYQALLVSKGEEELRSKILIDVTDGEVDYNLFTYGVDFNMGDIVQIEDDYGHFSRSRIVEMVFSQDSEGEKKFPVFSTV